MLEVRKIMEKLDNIVFDKEDQELFLIDDLQLKANAIRYSILPKLQVVINHAINQIDNVYGVNVFDDCMIAQAPHYRLHNRSTDVKKNYQYARVSIRGQRKYGKWNGIRKPDGKEPQLASFSLELKLMQEGLFIYLTNFSQLISKDSHKKVLQFLLRHDFSINMIQKTARVFEDRVHSGNEWLVKNEKWLRDKLKRSEFDITMASDSIPYPVKREQFKLAIDRLTLLYPIFHSYLQIAKGQKDNFNNLIVKTSDWLLKKGKELTLKDQEKNIELDLNSIKAKAATKVKVMPGIRWQVFQRDNWRCVACGRNAEHEIILHIDHITPRSKGGKDEMDNYQTLCEICNIGKSNKDKTDLRAKKFRNK